MPSETPPGSMPDDPTPDPDAPSASPSGQFGAFTSWDDLVSGAAARENVARPADEEPTPTTEPSLPSPGSAHGVPSSHSSSHHHHSSSHHHHSSSHRHRPSRRARRRRLRWIFGGIGVVVLLVLVGGAIAGYRFYGQAKDVEASLQHAKTGLANLSGQLKAGDKKQLDATASDITASVTHAAEIVDGPIWAVASRVPLVGQNVDAVRRVTHAVDLLAADALPAGVDVMSGLNTDRLTVQGGGLDLAPFVAAEKAIPRINAAFQKAKAQLRPIDTSSLIPQVADPVSQITSIIDDASPSLEFADRYLPTLLDVAGVDGKKTYLLIFQNNAESRATGGNPAAAMTMTVDRGKFALGEQTSSSTFVQLGLSGRSFTKLPADMLSIYRSSVGQNSQDFTMTPDFPTTAALFRNLWKQASGTTVDGVISIDPVVLSNMLRVAGPVTLTDGTKVTADNAVSLLLSQAYEKYPTGEQSDAFFAEVAKQVFTHLTSSAWDPQKMLEALQLSASEQRVNLNFADKKAQAVADQLGVDGALRTNTKAQTQMGIYLNDSSVGKLDYHLTQDVTLQCDAAKRTATETVTLKNTVPDSITSPYTLGQRNVSYGLPRTTMMFDVSFVAPPGAKITSTTPAKSAVADWARSGVEKGNTTQVKTVFVPQGKTVTVAYTVQLPDGPLGPLDLRHTPTARKTPVTVAAGCDTVFGQ